jgi:hypothetical protein
LLLSNKMRPRRVPTRRQSTRASTSPNAVICQHLFCAQGIHDAPRSSRPVERGLRVSERVELVMEALERRGSKRAAIGRPLRHKGEPSCATLEQLRRAVALGGVRRVPTRRAVASRCSSGWGPEASSDTLRSARCAMCGYEGARRFRTRVGPGVQSREPFPPVATAPARPSQFRCRHALATRASVPSEKG